MPEILTKSRLSRRIGIRLAFAMLLIGAPVRAEPPPTVEFDVPYQLQFLAGGSVVTTKVFVRDEGQWRLWIHHGSPVLDGMRDDGPD